MGPCPVFLSSVPVFLWCLCFNFRSNVLGLAKWPGDVWFSILFTWSLHARLFGILMASWILQMYGYLRCVMHIPWTIWSHALHTWKDKLTRLRQHKSMQYPTIVLRGLPLRKVQKKDQLVIQVSRLSSRSFTRLSTRVWEADGKSLWLTLGKCDPRSRRRVEIARRPWRMDEFQRQRFREITARRRFPFARKPLEAESAETARISADARPAQIASRARAIRRADSITACLICLSAIRRTWFPSARINAAMRRNDAMRNRNVVREGNNRDRRRDSRVWERCCTLHAIRPDEEFDRANVLPFVAFVRPWTIRAKRSENIRLFAARYRSLFRLNATLICDTCIYRPRPRTRRSIARFYRCSRASMQQREGNRHQFACLRTVSPSRTIVS